MPRPPASLKAYTLIEVMVAATVLVVSFSAVIKAVTRGAEMIDTARKQQIAQQIIEGEIAFQRTSPWNWGVGLIGIQEMVNSSYSITVNDAGTAATDDTANGRNDFDSFILDNNPELLGQAKGFRCEAQSQVLRPMAGAPTMIAITWTVTWPAGAGRTHSLTGVAHFGQNGLHLSSQR